MEESEKLITVGEFARLLDTTRSTLYHYDNLGILKPAIIKKNGYRYYHPSQAQTFLIIKLFSDCGLSLEDIRDHLSTFDENRGKNLLESAKDTLREKMRQLTQLEALLENKQQLYLLSFSHERWAPFLCSLPETHYFKSNWPLHTEARKKVYANRSIGISRYVVKYNEFPTLPFISQARIHDDYSGDFALEGYPANDIDVETCTHPAGIYAALLCSGTNYTGKDVVSILRKYAKQNGLELDNDLYAVDSINFVITESEQEYASVFFIKVLNTNERLYQILRSQESSMD